MITPGKHTPPLFFSVQGLRGVWFPEDLNEQGGQGDDNFGPETLHHLHIMRLAFPADHEGLFSGTDLAVFRQLGPRPLSLRDIQRRLRGINKDQCLRSLQRAANAGLAVELPGNFHQLPPSSACKLSETGGENTDQSHSQPPAAAGITENTEKPTPTTNP